MKIRKQHSWNPSIVVQQKQEMSKLEKFCFWGQNFAAIYSYMGILLLKLLKVKVLLPRTIMCHLWFHVVQVTLVRCLSVSRLVVSNLRYNQWQKQKYSIFAISRCQKSYKEWLFMKILPYIKKKLLLYIVLKFTTFNYPFRKWLPVCGLSSQSVMK